MQCLLQGQGSLLRGSKRYVPGEIASPSKRRRESADHAEHFVTSGTGRKLKNYKARITKTINLQSEIRQQASSSTEFKCGNRAKAGDESENC
jgi:hypothetical protein